METLTTLVESLKVEETKENYQVDEVIHHTISQGKYWFHLKYTGYEGTYLTDDDDCFCEDLISPYMKKRGLKTVYVFCRVSTKQQAGGVSLEVQKKTACDRAREMYGGEVRIKVVELKTSAYQEIPPLLQEIAEVSNSGDALFCYSIDRLSRNIVTYMDMLEKMRKKGVFIYSVEENLWYHEHQLSFLEGVLNAQKESFLIGKRVKASIVFRRQRGDKTLGIVPYGKVSYRDDNLRLMSKDNDEEKAVIGLIMNSDKKPCQLADELNKKGILKRGKKWTVGMIRYVRMTGNVLL